MSDSPSCCGVHDNKKHTLHNSVMQGAFLSTVIIIKPCYLSQEPP